jgi:hypothetical protein
MQALAAGLLARGVEAHPVPDTSASERVLARVHALMRGPNGEWIGAADPRWNGAAVGPIVFRRQASVRKALQIANCKLQIAN